MGDKKRTSTSTINYDPNALAAYHGAINTAMPIWQQFAQSPYSNPFFQMNLGMLNKQAGQAGATGMQNIYNMSKQMNLPQDILSPFQASQIFKQGRATSGLMQQGRFSAMQQANQQQQNALMALTQFQPLLTGQQTTEKTSGGLLGTLLGTGLAAGLAPFTGGLSLAGMPMAIGSGASGGGIPNPVSMSNTNIGALGGIMAPNPFAGGMGAYTGGNSFLPGESLGMPTNLYPPIIPYVSPTGY